MEGCLCACARPYPYACSYMDTEPQEEIRTCVSIPIQKHSHLCVVVFIHVDTLVCFAGVHAIHSSCM